MARVVAVVAAAVAVVVAAVIDMMKPAMKLLHS